MQLKISKVDIVGSYPLENRDVGDTKIYKQLESMRLLHLGVVQDRPWYVLVAFVSNACNISDDQPGIRIEVTQN